jgi:hypothetical protein
MERQHLTQFEISQQMAGISSCEYGNDHKTNRREVVECQESSDWSADALYEDDWAYIKGYN